ncbi:hypothetical protein BHM03_00038435 [Ensete ventricosum]|nr:hypothetical protein BHM03_00038435 [Ensete ventricosum]
MGLYVDRSMVGEFDAISYDAVSSTIQEQEHGGRGRRYISRPRTVLSWFRTRGSWTPSSSSSRHVFREYGNTMAATVLFAMDDVGKRSTVE